VSEADIVKSGKSESFMNGGKVMTLDEKTMKSSVGKNIKIFGVKLTEEISLDLQFGNGTSSDALKSFVNEVKPYSLALEAVRKGGLLYLGEEGNNASFAEIVEEGEYDLQRCSLKAPVVSEDNLNKKVLTLVFDCTNAKSRTPTFSADYGFTELPLQISMRINNNIKGDPSNDYLNKMKIVNGGEAPVVKSVSAQGTTMGLSTVLERNNDHYHIMADAENKEMMLNILRGSVPPDQLLLYTSGTGGTGGTRSLMSAASAMPAPRMFLAFPIPLSAAAKAMAEIDETIATLKKLGVASLE